MQASLGIVDHKPVDCRSDRRGNRLGNRAARGYRRPLGNIGRFGRSRAQRSDCLGRLRRLGEAHLFQRFLDWLESGPVPGSRLEFQLAETLRNPSPVEHGHAIIDQLCNFQSICFAKRPPSAAGAQLDRLEQLLPASECCDETASLVRHGVLAVFYPQFLAECRPILVRQLQCPTGFVAIAGPVTKSDASPGKAEVISVVINSHEILGWKFNMLNPGPQRQRIRCEISRRAEL
jgi:hypothetical protein